MIKNRLCRRPRSDEVYLCFCDVNMTPYDVLGLPANASAEDIKRVYRKKVLELHPDKTNGDKDKEAQFKAIHAAYQEITSPVDASVHSAMRHPAGVDINEMLRGMGFSFVFMDNPQQHQQQQQQQQHHRHHHNIFQHIFQTEPPQQPVSSTQQPPSHEPGQQPGQQQAPPSMPGVSKKRTCNTTVDVSIDAQELYRGSDCKKVEVDLREHCPRCRGTGDDDPSQLSQCNTCKGSGNVLQSQGSFGSLGAFGSLGSGRNVNAKSHRSSCPTCAGKGHISSCPKPCVQCGGERSVSVRKVFELRLPRGIPNNHEVAIGDVTFKFIHNLPSEYTVHEDTSVTYELSITVEELMFGFQRSILIYGAPFVVVSRCYFNPTEPLHVSRLAPHLGLTGIQDADHDAPGQFSIQFRVVFTQATDTLMQLSSVDPTLRPVVEPAGCDSYVIDGLSISRSGVATA